MVDFLAKIVTYALRSRTLIVAWMTFFAGLLGYLAGDEFIAQNPAVVAFLTSALGFVNLVLRYVTTVPLEEK